MAALTTFSSGPGQSYTFSVVIDPILEETGFSRTLLCAALLLRFQPPRVSDRRS